MQYVVGTSVIIPHDSVDGYRVQSSQSPSDLGLPLLLKIGELMEFLGQ